MAGFLLWLSITSIMIEVFKAASEQWLLFLHPRIPVHNREHGSILICKAFSNIIQTVDMIYFTMEGIVLSRCRHTTQYLGATLFKLRLHQVCKSHVAVSMHHGTWGLMQGHF